MRKWMQCLAVMMVLIPVASWPEDKLQLPPYQKIELKNGMTVLLMEQHEIPLISFSFLVRAGSVADPAEKEGTASVTASLLRKGTKTRTADQLSAELDFIGGTLDASATYDYTAGQAEFLKKDLAKGLDLLSDVLLNPTFPETEVTKLLKQNIDGVKVAKERPQRVLGTYFASYLYGSHPYGRPVDGDETSLAAIQREDIVKFFETYYTPGNTILAVAGDFNAAEMQTQIREKFENQPARHAPAVTTPEPKAAATGKLLLVNKDDSTQTYYAIGNVGISRTNPDRVAIDLVNTIFGGRFTSRLNTALRVNSGLTYGAFSRFNERKVPGPFQMLSFTQNASTEKAIDMTLDILKHLHEGGLTEQELKSAKAYTKGQFPPEIESTDQLAELIARLEFYGLNASEINDFYQRIDAVTLEDTSRVIGKYFPSGNLVFVLIGKAEEIGETAKKYAQTVDRKNITAPGF